MTGSSATFLEIFNTGGPVLSFEFFPPKKPEALQDTKDLIQTLSGYAPHFMTCTYGAGGGTRETTIEIVDYIANQVKIPAVAHLTCVSHTASDLSGILRELESKGVKHVLALRGDPPKGAKRFEVTEGGFSCARDLVKHISGQHEFSIAVAGYPETHPEATSPDADIDYLKSKIDAGAELIISQLFFDAEMYFRFRDKCQRSEINVPILPGLMPISSISQVRRFTEMCGATIPADLADRLAGLEEAGDQVIDFGTEFAIKTAKDLLAGGAPGIHLYTLNKSAQVAAIAEAAGFSSKIR